MKTRTTLIAAAILVAATGFGLAQTDEHHPAPESNAEAAASPERMQMMMQMMQNCMNMMQMMQGGMMGGGMMGGAAETGPQHGQMSEAGMAYMAAMAKMDAPMMAGIQHPDPDVAFVKGMIPHHQSAIDMARVVVEHGDDAEVKKLAEEIIAAQEREIAAMQAWLKEHGE
jgi:hypothetical protein